MQLSDLYTFLKQHRYAVVASTAADGTPQSALIGIAVTPELHLIFDTLNTTRKYANLKRSPRCSLVIGWGAEQTVQLEGLAEEPTGADLTRAQEAYFQVWPEGRTHLTWPGIAFFVVRPQWLRYSDYDQIPPCIQEFTPTS